MAPTWAQMPFVLPRGHQPFPLRWKNLLQMTGAAGPSPGEGAAESLSQDSVVARLQAKAFECNALLQPPGPCSTVLQPRTPPRAAQCCKARVPCNVMLHRPCSAVLHRHYLPLSEAWRARRRFLSALAHGLVRLPELRQQQQSRIFVTMALLGSCVLIRLRTMLLPGHAHCCTSCDARDPARSSP